MGWTELPADRAALLCHRLAEALARRDDGNGSVVEAVRIAPLSFYPGWMLCDIQTAGDADAALADAEHPDAGHAAQADGGALVPDGEAPARRVVRSVLYGPDGFTPLTGQSYAIHGHNHLHGVDLSSHESRCDYIRFFCYFVRGEAGPFEIREAMDGLEFGEDLAGDQREAVERALGEPRHRTGGEAPDVYVYQACILYGDRPSRLN